MTSEKYHKNGSWRYYKVGHAMDYFHREDGPAIIHDDHNYVAYWLEDERHNMKGPSIVIRVPSSITKHPKIHWHINGACVDDEMEEWCKHCNIDPISFEDDTATDEQKFLLAIQMQNLADTLFP